MLHLSRLFFHTGKVPTSKVLIQAKNDKTTAIPIILLKAGCRKNICCNSRATVEKTKNRLTLLLYCMTS